MDATLYYGTIACTILADLLTLCTRIVHFCNANESNKSFLRTKKNCWSYLIEV